MNVRPFVIDCDTGRDDALAIWICQRLGLALAGIISSYGNTTLQNVIDNNRRVTALGASHCGTPAIPLYSGCDAPGRLHRGIGETVQPRQNAAGNGLCNIILPEPGDDLAIETLSLGEYKALLCRLAADHGKVDYIITGPATNLAHLLEKDPALPEKIGTVTMMGGKGDALWTTIPGADFNVLCDPFAVRALLQGGLALRFVPMDATWPIVLTLPEIEALKPDGIIAQTAKEIMITHCRHFAPEPVFRFHDPSVIMACLNPEKFMPVKIDVICDEAAPDFARITASKNGFPAMIYQPDNTDRRLFLQEMLAALGF